MQTDLHLDERRPEIGPIPEDNRPGHHPDHEQDKPDLAAFRARMANPASADPARTGGGRWLLETAALATIGLGAVTVAAVRRAVTD